MNLLLVEHVCGGGMRSAELDPGLAAQGWAMLEALASDLALAGVTATVMVDDRIPVLPPAAELIRVGPADDMRSLVARAAKGCERVCVIAPESDGVLQDWLSWLESLGVTTLNAQAQAAALCADKLAATAWLRAAGVPVPDTTEATLAHALRSDWVLKPRMGAGCERTRRMPRGAVVTEDEAVGLIAQRYMPGTPCSASFIIKDGVPTPLLAGRQLIETDPAGHMSYAGGEMPLPGPLHERAIRLAERAVLALPGLAGFVGVDLILGDGEPTGDCVIEVNARLTMSYCGLRRLTTDNLALRMIEGGAAPRWTGEGLSFDARGRVTRHPPAGASSSPATPAPAPPEPAAARRPLSVERIPDHARASLALDIGGANLKAAHGCGLARSVPFALWKAPSDLPRRLAELASTFPAFESLRVTMTAELCDCFDSRREGVMHVLRAVQALAGPRPVLAWSTLGRWLTPDEIAMEPLPCAAGNWHAQATWLARCFPEDASLLADLGSTTCDLILLHRGGVVAEGLDDTGRLATGELVYLGVRRTPLAALGPTLDWGGRKQGLAAEWFSNTGDVFLLTGDLAEDERDTDTPDGRPFTRQAAAARVLRMVGADRESHEFSDAKALALACAAVMRRRIREAAQRVAQRAPVQRVIVTGSGAFLAAGALEGLAPSLLPLEESLGLDASACACAWALLHLEPPV